MEQYSAAPYLATLINCMVWTLYGLPMVHPGSILVVTINGSGTAIECVYIILFFIFSDKKKRLKVALVVMVEIVFVGVLSLLVMTLTHTHRKRSFVVGMVCILFNIMMYASPLVVMVSLYLFFHLLCNNIYNFTSSLVILYHNIYIYI